MTTTSLVFLGHVDHGKSTILGHFLNKIGIIDERTKEQTFNEAERTQMEKWKWAFLLDSLAEERIRGKTSDIAFQPFTTETKNFMLIDTPGHRDYVPATIRGATQADACVLVVSAESSDLTSGLKVGDEDNPGGQTRELAIIGSILGIKHIIIAINKMDLVDYSQKKFNTAVKKVMELFKEIQSPWIKQVTKESFVPISGWLGDNLVEKSDKMPWYEGYTLYEALDKIELQEDANEKQMRFLGQDIYDKPGFGTVINGRAIGNKIEVDDEVVVLPQDIKGEVNTLLTFDQEDTQSLDRGSYGIVVLRGPPKNAYRPGIVLAPSDEKVSTTIESITAKLLILEDIKRPLIPGKSVVMHCGASNTSVTIDEILEIEKQKKKRKSSGSVKIAFPGDMVTLKLQVDSPIVVEKFKDHPVLGRLILRHMGNTIAVGIVNDFE